jgi:hypothetical protein
MITHKATNKKGKTMKPVEVIASVEHFLPDNGRE